MISDMTKDLFDEDFSHYLKQNKEKIDIIEQMIKILYPNASDDELYDVTFNGEYIDKLKELKDTADTMLMANDIKKQDIDSLREANDRLEQENKELKEKIIELSEEKGHLIVENNTLKESNQSLSMLGTDLASANETVRKEFFRADKNKDMWREKAEEYHSALEEIRVIAENLSPCKLDYSDVYCHQTDCTDCIQRIILKKINEVLNENKSSK